MAIFAFQLLDSLVGRNNFEYVLRSPWKREQLPERLRAKDFEILTIPRPPFLLLDIFAKWVTFRRFCRRKGIDVVVNLDPYGSPAGGAARLLIVHDLYFRAIPKRIPRSVVLRNDLILRLMLSTSSEIVTVSDSTRHDLERWYPQARERTTTVHSATSLSAISADGPPLIEKPYVLAVGNATPNKNFAVLAKAMATVHWAVPDIAVVHVGADPDETIASTLNGLGSSLPVIRFEGIDEAKLTNLYRHASCLCVPSLVEGFCLPILEAQSLGCPVICSDRPAMPEIAGTGALLFDPTNPDALAKTLLEVLQNPGTSQSLISAGRENSARFSWDTAACQYETIFRRLIERGP
ncbi:glycosyltransferase family 4 protein [Bradyrhizobium sp.]|uniref:glycosyltransferase family 4 protein n=1 Tax=Bradyrhizobium sp. TaxID=376 RepID=UPI003C31A761